MKKTSNASTKKLSLNVQTIRTLTSQDLALVVGGGCQHGSNPSEIVPLAGNRAAAATNTVRTTC